MGVVEEAGLRSPVDVCFRPCHDPLFAPPVVHCALSPFPHLPSPSSFRTPLAHLQCVPVYMFFVVYTLKPCK